MDSIPTDADARHVPLTRLSAVLLVFCAAAGVAWSDGGALILHQRVGPLSVSVFASPAPLRAGLADLTVLLQDAETDNVLLDGTIQLELNKAGEPAITAAATNGQASNKLLYAASVQVPRPGSWNLTVRCREHAQQVVVRGPLTVLSAEAPVLSYWPYFALVPVAIGLFALNQRLKLKRRGARLPTRP